MARLWKKKASGKQKEIMPHQQFIDRIRKSLYFGNEIEEDELHMSFPLAEYASEIFSEPHMGYSLNRLNSVAACNLVRGVPTCSLIMALIYLDRLNATNPGYARFITPQELFVVSMMISTKFYAGLDEEIYLSDWAENAMISEDRLKQLEVGFLCAVDWNIYISNEDFFAKLQSIERTLAKREGLKRGWLTYTELKEMLPSFTLAKFLLNNIAVMAVSYAASVMTIAGAFFLVSQIPGTILHSNSKASSTTQANTSTTSVTTTANNATQIIDASDALLGNLVFPSTRDNASTLAITDGGGTNRNASCCQALNVEEELLKLEAQYEHESQLEQLRRKQNEINSESRLNLPQAPPLGIQMRKCNKQQLIKWQLFENEHSQHDGYDTHVGDLHDNDYAHENYNSYDLSFYKSRDDNTQQYWHNIEDDSDLHKCFAQGNCTSSSIFWHLLADAKHWQSFVRFPLTWLKFI